MNAHRAQPRLATVVGRQAQPNRRKPAEQCDDRQQEPRVAPGQEQEDKEERTSCEGHDRDRSPGGLAPDREGHRQRREHALSQ